MADPGCRPLEAPLHGSMHNVLSGYEKNPVLVFHCDPGFHLVGNKRVQCFLVEGSTLPRWNSSAPTCQENEEKKFEIAMLIALISGAVILLLSLFFLNCCLNKCLKKYQTNTIKGINRRRHVANVFEEGIEIENLSTEGRARGQMS